MEEESGSDHEFGGECVVWGGEEGANAALEEGAVVRVWWVSLVKGFGFCDALMLCFRLAS